MHCKSQMFAQHHLMLVISTNCNLTHFTNAVFSQENTILGFVDVSTMGENIEITELLTHHIMNNIKHYFYHCDIKYRLRTENDHPNCRIFVSASKTDCKSSTVKQILFLLTFSFSAWMASIGALISAGS